VFVGGAPTLRRCLLVWRFLASLGMTAGVIPSEARNLFRHHSFRKVLTRGRVSAGADCGSAGRRAVRFMRVAEWQDYPAGRARVGAVSTAQPHQLQARLCVHTRRFTLPCRVKILCPSGNRFGCYLMSGFSLFCRLRFVTRVS
jgi:hypothetical protein